MDCITCTDDRMPGAPFNCFGFRSNVISFGKINVVVVVVVVVVVAKVSRSRQSLQVLEHVMPIVERKRSGM